MFLILKKCKREIRLYVIPKKIIQQSRQISSETNTVSWATAEQVCKWMVIALNWLKSYITQQVGPQGTNKSILTKHRVRGGEVEEEKEAAEMCT